MADELNGLSTRGLLFVVAAAIVGGSGGSFLGNKASDSDIFTHKQAETMQTDLKMFVVGAIDLNKRERELQLRELEQKIKTSMPPDKTKQRIAAIEQYLSTNGYIQPTYDWQ